MTYLKLIASLLILPLAMVLSSGVSQPYNQWVCTTIPNEAFTVEELRNCGADTLCIQQGMCNATIDCTNSTCDSIDYRCNYDSSEYCTQINGDEPAPTPPGPTPTPTPTPDPDVPERRHASDLPTIFIYLIAGVLVLALVGLIGIVIYKRFFKTDAVPPNPDMPANGTYSQLAR